MNVLPCLLLQEWKFTKHVDLHHPGFLRQDLLPWNSS